MINYFINYVKSKINNEKGQGMVEYALIIALVAVLLVVSITALKDKIVAVFTAIVAAL